MPLLADSGIQHVSVTCAQQRPVESGDPMGVTALPGCEENTLVLVSSPADGDGRLVAERGDSVVELPLSTKAEERPLLVTAGYGMVSIAKSAGDEIVTVSAAGDELDVDTWMPPAGVIGDLHPHPDGPVALVSVGPQVISTPDGFHERATVQELKVSATLNETIWHWRTDGWTDVFVTIADTLVFTFDMTVGEGSGVALGCRTSALDTDDGDSVELILFGDEAVMGRSVVSGLIPVDAAGSSILGNPETEEVIVTTGESVAVYPLEGGEPRWEFQPRRTGPAPEEIVGVVVMPSGRTVVATGRHAHFLGRDGAELGRISTSSVVTGIVAPLDGPEVFVLLTETGFSLYDGSGRLHWREDLPSSPKFAEILISGEEEKSGTYRLLLATSERVYDYLLDLDF